MIGWHGNSFQSGLFARMLGFISWGALLQQGSTEPWDAFEDRHRAAWAKPNSDSKGTTCAVVLVASLYLMQNITGRLTVW
eukprot:4892903-Amphidinium_carterae.1